MAIMQMLIMVHSQWNFCNGLVHERDTQGLKLVDAAQLQQAIEMEFKQGKEGLAQKDQFYINQGIAEVLALPLNEKCAWIEGIRIARREEED